MGLYETMLSRLGANQLAPELPRPRDSASVVLWRNRGDQIEVFWIERAAGLAFMGGFHAFPGGGVSRQDAATVIRDPLPELGDAQEDAALPEAVLEGARPLSPAVSQPVVACALRELFEETGVLVVKESSGGDSVISRADRLTEGRRQLESREISLASLLDALHLELDSRRLVYAGRWLTPPLGPIRFDNRFFLVEWPKELAMQPQIFGGEAESGEWIVAAAALERWQRGEIVTAPPILHILRVLSEDGPRRGLTRLRNPVEANLGPHRRVEFRPGILMFPVRTPTLPPAAFTNAYVVGNGEMVLVDPGSPWEVEIERLLAAVRVLEERRDRRLVGIWLTHHHPDHVGGVAALRQALAVPVCAHHDTARRLLEIGLTVDQPLAEGDRLVLDGDPPMSLRVLHTPGHARGHLCFLHEELGSLIAGDLVAGFGTIVVDPPEGDMEEYLKSLERIEGIRPSTLFPAHGPPIACPKAKLQEYREHRLWRESRIVEAWQQGLRSPSQILPQVYDDLAAAAHPLAERQIEAHLERLRRQGRLSPESVG